MHSIVVVHHNPMDENPVQYDAENYSSSRQREGGVGLSGWVIKIGLAKDEKQANTILTVILVACVIIGVGIWFVL